MLSKIKHAIFTFLLCVTLLSTMGFDYMTRMNIHPETTSNSSVEMNSKEQITEIHSLPIETSDPLQMIPDPSLSSEPSPNLASQNEEQLSIKPALAEVTQVNYEVTAYYLNVRAEANGASKILDVVTKGSTLEVVSPKDQEWLELKSGGYVHSSYAKLISSDAKPAIQLQMEKQSPESEVVVQALQPSNGTKQAEPSKPTSKVKSASGLTEEHIAKIIENTALEGQGLEKPILEIEETYGINSYFTIAVMKLESGHGKSRIATTKNNLFGLNAVDSDAYNKAISFKTKGDSVKEFGQIISKFYLDKGLTSIEKVAGKYCQANSKWPSLVKNIMNSDYKKIA